MSSDLVGVELFSALTDALKNMDSTLSNARSLRALTIRDAAREIGVAPSTVFRVEHGGSCTTDVAVAIFRWLGGCRR